MVKRYVYELGALQNITDALSQDRLQTYLAATNNDLQTAMKLYAWNVAISAAFYGPLQCLEVAMRNAMHRELTSTYGPAWYDNPGCNFDRGTHGKIAGAKRKLTQSGYPIDPGHMVAELSFGFWVALLGRGGKNQNNQKTNYEMTLFRPALHKAFRNARLSRTAAHTPLNYLRTFRNRIAHHEPIFARRLDKDHQHILEVTGWISDDTKRWIEHHSRVEPLLVARNTKIKAAWKRIGELFWDCF